jgi:hypothetical protein
LVGKSEEKRSLGRPRRRWENNIKMDLLEVWCGDMDWINRAQYRDRWRRFVIAVVNLRVPQNACNLLSNWTPVGFSRSTLLYGVSKTHVELPSDVRCFRCLFEPQKRVAVSNAHFANETRCRLCKKCWYVAYDSRK